jgi:hypothetical protein
MSFKTEPEVPTLAFSVVTSAAFSMIAVSMVVEDKPEAPGENVA